jgi:hypothetical protein
MSEELRLLRDDLWEDLDDEEDLDDLESLEEWREELLLLDLDEDLEDLWESVGTSRMFSSRPVVGSTTESTPGLWAMWYPSMM